MWTLVRGTIRPISFVSWVPMFVGALIAGNPGWHLLIGGIGVVLCVGFTNSFNNLTDYGFDRLNPAKVTLAKEHPLKAFYISLALLPIIAFSLRSSGLNNYLLAFLWYGSIIYAYTASRVRILKRVVTAIIIAATAFLAVDHYPLALWIWATLLFIFFYWRESRKDSADFLEDNEKRFQIGDAQIDPWCVFAPFGGSTLFLMLVWMVRQSLNFGDFAVALCFGLAIWSYIQIRERHGCYRVKLNHSTMWGRLGIVSAAVGLMPSNSTALLVSIFVVNCYSILSRSFSPEAFRFHSLAQVHDALLWASIPILAMVRVGQVTKTGTVIAIVLFVITLVYEHFRLKRILKARQTNLAPA